jgi:3-oxoacyl-[acyl-carrier-protein] synthase II
VSGAADRRVVITGLGAITPIGVGAEEFAAGLRAGRSGAQPISAFDTGGFEHTIGCEVVGFDPASWLVTLDPAELGRVSRFSASAARMAVADAGLTDADLRGRHGLIAIGTTYGESGDIDRLVGQEVADGGTDPAIARRVNASRLSVTVAHELGLADVEAVTIPTACAAGNYAVGYGFDAIRDGTAEFALCGGADAMCRMSFAAFYRLGAMAPERCQPFDKNRRGMLTGEGGGVLVLEELAAARARGARIHAEVLGYGLNCDAGHQVAPDSDSVARCMELALRDGGVKPGDIDFISAHGTATKVNDVAEARAIRRVFGDDLPRTVSIKSMIGHTFGAAGALGTIGCTLAITGGFIPPTINHVETDPECALDCVPNTAVPADLRIVQNNALAFGGNNAVVVLGRVEERR